MYLSIGQNCFIKKKYIIGIFDIENTTENKRTKDFLTAAQKKEEIEYITDELPRSFILYEEKGEKKVYITPFSTATLKKRFKMKNQIE